LGGGLRRSENSDLRGTDLLAEKEGNNSRTGKKGTEPAGGESLFRSRKTGKVTGARKKNRYGEGGRTECYPDHRLKGARVFEEKERR